MTAGRMIEGEQIEVELKDFEEEPKALYPSIPLLLW
jgi:hypothetical protein